MHMIARANANEMLMRLARSLDENLSLIIFLKLCSRFKYALKKIIVYTGLQQLGGTGPAKINFGPL